MGEISAKGEGILGDYVENEVVLPADTCLSFEYNFGFLYSNFADKFKYFQGKAVVYNKCIFSHTHGAPLMVDSKGARKNEF
jgi:hypothetical protein